MKKYFFKWKNIFLNEKIFILIFVPHLICSGLVYLYYTVERKEIALKKKNFEAKFNGNLAIKSTDMQIANSMQIADCRWILNQPYLTLV